MAKKKNPMREEYVRLITEHDKTLSLLRGEWIAATDKERNKWMVKINSSLDERSRLMSLRDSK